MPVKKSTKKPVKQNQPKLNRGPRPKKAVKKILPEKGKEKAFEGALAPENNNVLYSWQANEFEFREKGVLWYAIAGLLLAISVIYAITVGNYLFAVIAVLLVYLIVRHAHEDPGILNHEIRTDGIKVGTHYFSYENLRGFWIAENANKLYLISTHRLLGIVNFHLDGADIERVRHELGNYIPETSHTEEDFFDKVGRILKI